MTAKFQDYLINDFDTEENGNKAVGVEITIYEAGTRTPAVLLDENDVQITNPVTTNEDGYYEFYIAGGSYDFVTDVGTDKEKYIYVAEPILVRGASLTPLNGGVWADGQIFTTYDEYMIFGGTAYRPLASTSLPYTVGPSPDLAFVEPVTLSDHNLLTNRNAIGAHDQIYPRQLESVSDFATANLPAGLKIGTKGYSGPDGVGAADYETMTIADFRDLVGDPAATADNAGEAFETADPNILAVLISDFTIERFGVNTVNIPSINSQRFNNACTAAMKRGYKKVTGEGTYVFSGKCVINTVFDGSSLKMQFTDAGVNPVSLEVSTGSDTDPSDIFDLDDYSDITLPSIECLDKPAVGWGGLNNVVGVRYINVQNADIREREVTNFSIGVQHTSKTQGCGYNNVRGGYLRNNKVNRQFTTILGGNSFTNRWDIYGGRYFHSSAEGTEGGPTNGVIHVDIEAQASGNIINDINFFGASLEGTAEQYHIKCGGTYCQFLGVRLESSNGLRVHWANNGIGGQGTSNLIAWGRGVDPDLMTITQDSGADFNTVLSTRRSNVSQVGGSDDRQHTSSSASPARRTFEAGLDLFQIDRDTLWSVSESAQTTEGKRSSDSFARTCADHLNGKFLVGNGTVAPSAGLKAVGSSNAGVEKPLYTPTTPVTPSNVGGHFVIFSDVDGSLKVRFGDGTINTITLT